MDIHEKIRILTTKATRKIKRFFQSVLPGLLFSSMNYWENRYRRGRNSGVGSYDHLAEFKAKVINNLIHEKNIRSVVEFGSGDGNQLRLFQADEYVGLDVSKSALKTCISEYRDDPSKSFFLYHPRCFLDHADRFECDAALSLDVIYHLVEDDLFELHMRHLFSCAKQYVVIYSSNREERTTDLHVKHRKFTEWIDRNQDGWVLDQYIENEYPLSEFPDRGSWCDFYIYARS